MQNEIEITKDLVKKLLPARAEISHKGSFGNVLNIAGSINYRGAAFLSTKSVLKVGGGFVALCSIEEVINTVSKLCPEAVFYPLKKKYGTISETEVKKIAKISEKYKVISIGCGISSAIQKQTNIENFFKKFINFIADSEQEIIIDADGLNLIAKLKIINLPKKTILTPHPAELSRLINVPVAEIQSSRTMYAIEAAKMYKSIIVLKGAKTVITDGKSVYINPTANSALAKAGSGDVLTGIISGLLAQGLSPLDASILGTNIHGQCGEFLAQKLSEYSVNASDLIETIPDIIKKIQNY